MVAHGTESRYVNQACRCPECKKAHAAAMKARRAERRRLIAENPDLATHGSANTYLNWLCRCGPCKAAYANSRAQQRAARQSTAKSGEVSA